MLFPVERIMQDISIHALREESDSGPFCGDGSAVVFLSTLSVRRATIFIGQLSRTSAFLSTLSVRRATADYFRAYALI